MSRAVLQHVVISSTDVSPNTNIVSGAQVTVYEEDGTTLLAQTMYSGATGGTTLSNPLTANASGFVKAYVAYPQRCVLKVNGVSYPSSFDLDPSEPALHAYLKINVKMPPYNAVGDGIADDTAAIQAALDEGASTRLSVYIPQGDYLVSNLKMYAGTVIYGEALLTTTLYAKPGSTGIGLRERTAAEGNAAGASFIGLSNIRFDGQSSWTTGVSLGFQVANFQWGDHAWMHNVAVQFCTGTGLELQPNVADMVHIWVQHNDVGLHLNGGGVAKVFGINAEFNATADIWTETGYCSFYGVQIENSEGAIPIHVGTSATYNVFRDVFISPGSVANTDVFTIDGGGSPPRGFEVHGLHFLTNVNGVNQAGGHLINYGNVEHVEVVDIPHGSMSYVAVDGGYYLRSGLVALDKLWVGDSRVDNGAGAIGCSGGVYPGGVTVFPMRRFDPGATFVTTAATTGVQAHPTVTNPVGGHVEIIDSFNGYSALYRVEGSSVPTLVSGNTVFAAGTAAAANKITLWWDAGTSTMRVSNNLSSNTVLRTFWRGQ